MRPYLGGLAALHFALHLIVDEDVVAVDVIQPFLRRHPLHRQGGMRRLGHADVGRCEVQPLLLLALRDSGDGQLAVGL